MLAVHQGTWRKERDGPLPEVAALDQICKRYGWDYWTYQAQPAAFIDEVAQLIRAEQEAEAWREREQWKERLRTAPETVPESVKRALVAERSTDDLLAEAAAQGFEVPS